MSETQQGSNRQTDLLVDELFPKILANHVSKLPELETVSYDRILDTAGDLTVTPEDRLHRIAAMSGRTGILEALNFEASILRFSALGREDLVTDRDRQAAYARSDANQMVHAEDERNLDYYLQHGIEIVFSPDAREEARQYCDIDDRSVPLLEKLKAKRLVTINGFDNSRVMYAVHDLIDHAWLFDQMRESGIMARYDDFLRSIEMDNDAFLYSRQAELLASVGFGSRRWQSASIQNEPLVLDASKIKDVLGSIDDERTATVTRMLDGMPPEQLRQVVYMIENMAVQFADERRRWGAVKQVDADGNRRPMDLFDPLHIAMMIETLDMLQRSQTYDTVQLAASLEVDAMLADTVSDKSSSDRLWIPVPRINPGDVIKLDNANAEWIQQNIGVSTSYNRIG